MTASILTAFSHGSRFHLANGLCFVREDGRGEHEGQDVIRIFRVPIDRDPLAEPLREEDVICRTSLSGFASVIAHLGMRGETADTHERALSVLTGDAS